MGLFIRYEDSNFFFCQHHFFGGGLKLPKIDKPRKNAVHLYCSTRRSLTPTPRDYDFFFRVFLGGVYIHTYFTL